MAEDIIKPEKSVLERKPALKSPFNPYDLVIVGYDDHPGIAADTKADPERGITAQDAERRRKLYVQLFDERAHLPLTKEFVNGIRAHGIVNRVKYIVFDAVAYVIDGRQRIRAARAVHDEQKKLGIEAEHIISVPGDQYKGDIDQLFALSRILNVHVDEPAMMKARSMTRLLMEDIVEPGEKPRKRTVQEVATIYSCSDQHVRDMTKLFESSDTVKKALEELKQPTIGLLLTGLPEEKQIEVLAELHADQKAGRKVTVASARGKVQGAKGKAVNSPSDKVETMQRLITKLADQLGDDGDATTIPVGELLSAIDGIVRALWGGNKAAKFPTPIAKQNSGYTLGVIAKLGD